MPGPEHPYHCLDGIEQLLADAIAEGWAEGYDQLLEAAGGETGKTTSVAVRNLRTAAGQVNDPNGGQDAVVLVAAAAARALNNCGVVQVAAEARAQWIGDLLIIGRDEWPT